MVKLFIETILVMKSLKLHFSLELPDGSFVNVDKAYDLVSGSILFSDLEETVSHIGFEVLPLLEFKLLEQMSLTFVGEKNQV